MAFYAIVELMTTLPNTLGPFFRYFIRKQKWLFILAQLFALAWTLDNLAWPYIMKILIDKITAYTGDGLSVWSYLSLPILLGVSLWVSVEIFYRGAGILMAFGIPKLEADVRLSMFDYVQKHSYRYFSDNFAGAISNKISDMTQSFTRIIQSLIFLFVPATLALLLSTLFFATVSPFFGSILGGWIVVHAAVCIYFSKPCDEYALIHSNARSDLTGKVVDALTNHINIRLFAKNRYEIDYLKKYQEDEQKKHFRSLWVIEKMKLFLGLASFFGPGILLNGYMLFEWGQGHISAGDVVYLFNTSWNMMMMAWFAGLELPLFFKEIGIAKQALGLIQLTHEIADKPSAKPLVVDKGIITFENVSFRYGDQEAIFQNKNLIIHAGEKVGLVGFSGSGKTTFVHLILRYYDLDKGRILIDHQDIASVTLDSLRSAISMIPQDPTLFHRSIRENIAYGKIGASPEEILEAAKKAHVDEFVQSLPEKYDALVGERGIKLSGGQKQRVAIARAILKNAPILILDEATSSLDSVTEKHIQEGLVELMRNKTTLVIAHRLSTLSDMDRILVFDKGVIIEEGSHEELIRLKGHYALLWSLQAGGFLPNDSEA
jgi:ATP-binding cassette subfamily B protein